LERATDKRFDSIEVERFGTYQADCDGGSSIEAGAP